MDDKGNVMNNECCEQIKMLIIFGQITWYGYECERQYSHFGGWGRGRSMCDGLHLEMSIKSITFIDRRIDCIYRKKRQLELSVDFLEIRRVASAYLQ